MRTLSFRTAGALVAASALLMAVAGPATAAGPPQPVQIISRMVITSPPNAGWFSSAGSDLICEGGDVLDTNYVWGGYTPNGAQLQVDKTFDCGDGEIYFRLMIRGVFVDETFRWVVLGGTGSYAGLRGWGTGYTESAGPDAVDNYYEGFLL